MVWNVLAIAIAAAALLMSSVLAMQQARLMLRANHIPVYMEIFSQIRSTEFQEHYRFVVNRLAQENVAEETGISGLPDEARAAVYDLGGLYTQVATLRLLGAIDRRVDSMMQVRLVRAWKVLAPFVYEERRRLGVSNMYWRAFEEFAADIERLPEGSINDLIAQHRRHHEHRRWRAARPARRRNAPSTSRQAAQPPTPALPEAAAATATAAGIPATPPAQAPANGTRPDEHPDR